MELLPDEPMREEETFDPHRVEGLETERDDWISGFDETMMMRVPALPPGGEEAVELSTAIHEKLRCFPEATKAEIRRTHHQLGHSSRDALLRMAPRLFGCLFHCHWWCSISQLNRFSNYHDPTFKMV